MNRAVPCLFLLAASGCRTPSPQASPPVAASPVVSSRTAVVGTATGPGPAVRIVWWTVPDFAPARADAQPWALDAALEAFGGAHPEIEVSTAVRPAYGAGGIVDYLGAARRVAPGDLPDLVTLPLEAVRDEEISPLLAAVWDQVPAASSDSLFPFAATSVAGTEGQALALPFAVDVVHLVSRAEAGPASWSALGAAGPWIVPYPAAECRALSPALALNQAEGGEAAALERVAPSLLQPALGFLAEAARAGEVAAAPEGSDVGRGAWSAFLQRKAKGVAVSGGTFVRYQSSFPALAWGPPPDSRSTGSAVGCGWALAVTAPDPARVLPAAALARWLTGPQQGGWVVAAGYLPAQRDAWAGGAGRGMAATAGADYLLFLQSLLDSALPVRGSGQWEQSLAAAYDAALRGAAPAAGSATSP